MPSSCQLAYLPELFELSWIIRNWCKISRNLAKIEALPKCIRNKSSEILNFFSAKIPSLIYINEVVEVIAGKGEGQESDSKPDRDIVEIDDDAVFDAKIENSELSDEETIVEVNEGDIDEDVRSYDEILVNENDDQLDY